MLMLLLLIRKMLLSQKMSQKMSQTRSHNNAVHNDAESPQIVSFRTTVFVIIVERINSIVSFVMMSMVMMRMVMMIQSFSLVIRAVIVAECVSERVSEHVADKNHGKAIKLSWTALLRPLWPL